MHCSYAHISVVLAIGTGACVKAAQNDGRLPASVELGKGRGLQLPNQQAPGSQALLC
jgi:hypothetical protein